MLRFIVEKRNVKTNAKRVTTPRLANANLIPTHVRKKRKFTNEDFIHCIFRLSIDSAGVMIQYGIPERKVYQG